jgi:integrase
MSRDVLQKNVNARVFSKDMIDATKIFFLENTTHWNAFRFHRAKFAFECAMLLGLRIHEIAHGKMSCFQKMRGNWFFCLTGKGNKYAEIPCPNQLMDMLVSYRKVLWLSAYPSKDETTVLCPRGQSHLETSISDRQIYNELKYAFSEAATHADDETAELLKKASPHWLRHGYVSHQVAFGIPITEVMENARHSDIKTTMLYVHNNKDERHKKASAVSI